jgi:hypothetical protein
MIQRAGNATEYQAERCVSAPVDVATSNGAHMSHLVAKWLQIGWSEG